MTKYRKKVPEHIEEKWVRSTVVCDLCKEDINKSKHGNASEIQLDAKIGSHYGTDGDARQGYCIDVCDDCFLKKIKPAIESSGINWHEYDSEDSFYINSSHTSYWVDEK